MAIHSYNETARRRIRNTVLRVESLPRPGAGLRARTSVRQQLSTLAQAEGDVPHNAVGTFNLMGSNWQTPSQVAGTQLEAFNFGQRIWDKSLVLLERVSLASADGTDHYGQSTTWVVIKSWSATRIRGTSTAVIAPGSTGTINGIVTIDGAYGFTSASVYLPTDHISVAANMKVWAELVGDRWEAYAADCQEA